MSLSSMDSFSLDQKVFYKVFLMINGILKPIIYQNETIRPNQWNTRQHIRIINTSMTGALYHSGYHSFLLKDDAYDWLQGSPTRKNTSVQLWEVEVKNILMMGDIHNKYNCVVSEQIFPIKPLGFIHSPLV